MVTKMKPNINSVEVHPQSSNNWHPVDGALVGAGSLWPKYKALLFMDNQLPPTSVGPNTYHHYYHFMVFSVPSSFVLLLNVEPNVGHEPYSVYFWRSEGLRKQKLPIAPFDVK
jgi:hypothetical protein